MKHKVIMKKYLFLLFILLNFSPIYAQSSEYRIDGKPYCKQIYDDRNNQITSFKDWELIEDFFVSPDKTKMLVYHRPDKSRAFFITLYDLKNNNIIAECEPGWACFGVIWTDDYLIYKWATSGGGMRFEYRNYQTLTVEKSVTAYFPFEDVENNVLICASHFISNDDVTFHNLSDGSLIKTVNLQNELLKKNIYANGISMSSIKKTGIKKYKFTFLYYRVDENDQEEDHQIALEFEL